MFDDRYNPDDPAFLASRAMDEELNADQRAALDEALASSLELRRQVADLERTSKLVVRWAGAPADIDWETHAKLIHSEVAHDADAQRLRSVDRLLHAWGAERVSFDEHAFAGSVLDRIGVTHTKRSVGRVFVRIGAPLAAAAIVALAVSLRFLPAPAPTAVSVVSIGPRTAIESRAVGVEASPRAVVMFARSPALEPRSPRPRASFRFVSVRVSPAVVELDDGAPL